MAYPDSVTGGNDPPPHRLLLLWLTTGKAHRGKRPSIHRMMPSWFTGKTHRGRKQPSSINGTLPCEKTHRKLMHETFELQPTILMVYSMLVSSAVDCESELWLGPTWEYEIGIC